MVSSLVANENYIVSYACNDTYLEDIEEMKKLGGFENHEYVANYKRWFEIYTGSKLIGGDVSECTLTGITPDLLVVDLKGVKLKEWKEFKDIAFPVINARRDSSIIILY